MFEEIRIEEGHLGTKITLFVTCPDGTREFEALGSSLGETLQELADAVQAEGF